MVYTCFKGLAQAWQNANKCLQMVGCIGGYPSPHWFKWKPAFFDTYPHGSSFQPFNITHTVEEANPGVSLHETSTWVGPFRFSFASSTSNPLVHRDRNDAHKGMTQPTRLSEQYATQLVNHLENQVASQESKRPNPWGDERLQATGERRA